MSLADLGIVRTSPKEIAEDFRTGRAFREGGEIAADIGVKAEKFSPYLTLFAGPLIGGLTAAWGMGMQGAGTIVNEFGKGVEAGGVDAASGARMASAVGKITGIEKGVTDALERNKGVQRTSEIKQQGALPQMGRNGIRNGDPESEFYSNGQRKLPPREGSEEYKKAEAKRKRQEKQQSMKLQQEREQKEKVEEMKHTDIDLANPNMSDVKNLSLFEKVKYFAEKKKHDEAIAASPRVQGELRNT